MWLLILVLSVCPMMAQEKAPGRGGRIIIEGNEGPPPGTVIPSPLEKKLMGFEDATVRP